MKRLAGLAVLAIASIALVATLATSAPQPSVVPTAWQLEIQFQDPTPIRVEVPGQRGAQTFWYMLYTVTNKSGQDQTFVPSFTIYTDSSQVIRAGEKVSPAVFRAIQIRHNNPLLKDVSEITGKLLQGEDNAKDCVAIFQNIDGKARSFDVFIGGLSGEAKSVKLPVKVAVDQTDLEGNVKKVMTDTILLHKTLQVSYKLPGEAGARFSAVPQRTAEKWVMR